QMSSHLKAKATQALSDTKLHPMAAYQSPAGRIPSPWARKYWCPFVDSERQMETAIRYVENNPIKAGLKPQRWSFVKPYRG
ncbi:MAG: hypothetical protein AB8C95_05190, partial [Phycisphaeraceae bacterium]